MGMLVLTRRAGQRIMIDGGDENGGTTITLLEVCEDESVRLGFNAPRAVRIEREEIVGEGEG